MKKYFNIILLSFFYLFVITDITLTTVWHGYISDRYLMFQDYLKPFIIICLLWTIFFILVKLSWFKTSRFVFLFILLITIISAGVYRYLHKLQVHFSEHTIKAILQTNFAESYDFLTTYILDKKIILSFLSVLIIGFLLCETFIRYKSKTHSTKKSYKNNLLLTTLLIFTCTSCFLITEVRPVKLFLKTYMTYKSNINHFKELALNQNRNIIANKNGGAGELYVLVIGESHNKEFTHLFNNTFSYTSPNLDKLNKNNLLLLNNAYTSISHTVPSLELALTNNTIEKKASTDNLLTLQNVVNKAGFNTYWLSNQAMVGQYSSPISIIAFSSTHQYFLNQEEWKETSAPDGVILHKLDNILNKLNPLKNNLIIIHLMGSHDKYEDRFPKTFQIQPFNYPSQGLYGEVFGGDNEANKKFSNYINSIAYNDFVMGELISKLNKTDSFRGLFYFADHGEDPLFGHDFNKHTPLMLRIPAYFYLTDKYISTYPNTYQNLIKNKDSIFINDSVFDNMIDFLQIDCIYNNKEKSLANDNFKSKPIEQLSIVDNIKLTTDPYYNLDKRASNKKIYLHRADSLYKAKFAHNFGINRYEIDLIYDKDHGLIINHDQYHQGDLHFKEFLKQHNVYSQKLWLDIKNLTSENKDEILKELNQLDKSFNLKEKSLIESQYPEALPKLINQGWTCSYYLPWRELLNEETQTIQEIKDSINKYNIKGISYDFFAHDKINEFFKEEIKDKNIKLYAWDLANSLSDPNLQDSLAKYDNLEIILLPLQTPFDY